MNKREHLLTCLIEECSEIQKPICKAQRFGENDHYPEATITNIEEVENEIDDLMGVIELLREEGILRRPINPINVEKKKAKIKKYMEYARNVGALI